METTAVKKTNPGLVYGLIGGLIFILITLGQYLAGLEAFLSPIGFASYAVLIIVAVLAGLKQKKTLGYLEFGEALKITFTVFAVGILLQSLFVYVLFNFIDVPFREALSQEVMNKMEVMMKKFGASETQIDEAMKNEMGKNQYAFGKVMIGYGVSCIISFICALIISAIIQKRKPAF